MDHDTPKSTDYPPVTNTYSYDLRNPFSHLKNVDETHQASKLSLASTLPMILAAIIILIVMLRVG